MRIAAFLIVLLGLAACGVDAPPVPPGEDNPENISSPEEIRPEGFF